MNLIFLGSPGVGKGTHAEQAAKHYNILKISTGDMLREEVSKATELGRAAKKYIDAGELVPDETVIGMLKQRIEKPEYEKGFILDGFPRTIAQADALEKITNIELVVNFCVSEETLMQRLGGRITCKSCDAIFHVQNRPPKKEGICDECGGELYMREDQKPEVIKQRLETYEKETRPLIDYYKDKRILVDFNAEGSIPEVSKRVIELLGSHFRGT